MQEQRQPATISSDGRRNGTPPSPPADLFDESDALDEINRIELALGIKIFEDRIVPTEDGIITVASEHEIQLLSRKTLMVLRSVWHLGTIAVGALYGYVFSKLFDTQSILETIILLIVGICFAISGSTIVEKIWSRYVMTSSASKKKRKGLTAPIATTLLVAVMDLATQGYFIHSILNQDSFLPPSTISTVASFGISLMATTILIMLAKLSGSEEALYQLSVNFVLDRALNTYHEIIAEAMSLLRRIEAVKSNELLVRHKP